MSLLNKRVLPVLVDRSGARCHGPQGPSTVPDTLETLSVCYFEREIQNDVLVVMFVLLMLLLENGY